MAKKLELQLVRSTICTPQWMRVIVRTLALKKMQQKKIVSDTPAIRGMVARVPHLVSMKEIEG
ncbi:50S ribosomal protein L30 [bacterium]|nr:50S ribosomal protein L30 [bacterium]